MLQNIEMAPSRESVEKLKKLGRVTSTTAHDAYSTSGTEESLGCLVHKFSVCLSPGGYLEKTYSEKENLMIISPDSHELKSKILDIIAKEFPQLQLTIIRNLTYEQYKKLISKAKWAITFGEGLDGYFLEPILSGGIAFAAYNNKFFTEDFKALQTVYQDYDTLIKNICTDIGRLDNESSYTQYQRMQLEICAKHYDYKEYKNNIASFYIKYYSKTSEA